MKVWELIADLERAHAGSVVTIAVPENITRKEISEGLDARYCLVHNESGLVTIEVQKS